MKAERRYLNRELSWLKFNQRVLEEARNRRNPLLERVKFLAIFESNLDEFYMVRVSSLVEQFESGDLDTSVDGLTPNEQLSMITAAASPLRREASRIFEEELKPLLEEAGIYVRNVDDVSDRARREIQNRFETEIFPVLTPLLLTNPEDGNRERVPFMSNRSLNLAVMVRDEDGETRLTRVKVPNGMPRLIRVGKRKQEYVLLEDVIRANVRSLFPGVELVSAHLFRVIRDADVEARQTESDDVLVAIQEMLRMRRFGDPVLLQHEPGMPREVVNALLGMLELDAEDAMEIPGLLAMDALYEVGKIDRATLRFPPLRPHIPEGMGSSRTVFGTIRQGDVLLHHPYDSFRSVEEFVAAAARDPDVLGIKMTMYRVGQESPLVEKLIQAAEKGKQVAVMVELKARFDEDNNIAWASALEEAGAHVTYGFRDLKTHCKLCQIVRREPDGVRTYCHIGTGNYNPATARVYTDLGLFTDDPEIALDVSELFNNLTGFSRQMRYRKLLVAPTNMRESLLARVRREMRHAKVSQPARMIWKVNALVDPPLIDALYEASQAGVQIDLIIRGVCCLRPGVPGLSDNIRVRSIVGRFLEHSRIYMFGNAGEPEVFLGSADGMRRNLDRRIEVLAPLESPDLVNYVVKDVLEPCLKDNQQSWALRSDGEYARVAPAIGEPRFEAQEAMMEARRSDLG